MIPKYVLLFFTYSIFGWIMEVILSIIQRKKLINRGFLIGPYCPIYGIGVILITIFLAKYKEDRIITFVMSILICGTLEYFTSYFMEKIFHARWWDYSNKKMNINGRICLETLIPFGILAYGIIYFANPLILGVIELIPELITLILAIVLITIFVIDTVISFKLILNLSKVSKLKLNVKDNTEEISKKVRKIIQDKLRLHRRIIKAFPYAENSIKFKEWIAEQQEKIKERQEKIKQGIKETQARIQEDIKETQIRIQEEIRERQNKINKKN
jgi:uncharacterized membrane protein